MERIVIWKKYGFAPWRWDGYPDNCNDPSITVYWAQLARDYEVAYTDANDWIELVLTETEKKLRAQRRKVELMQRYMGTGPGGEYDDWDDD